MATTALTNQSNRFQSESYLTSEVAAVALDAGVAEAFILPNGFGQLLVSRISADVLSFSGAYVAPAPAFDGAQIQIQSQDGSTRIDNLGSSRFVHIGTVSARPWLSAYIEYLRYALVRQADRFVVVLPILAGAGVTGTVRFAVTGVRISTG